jgi:putative heme-binding domain-containing protein
MLTDERQGIRRMAALGLMEEGDRDLQRRALSFLEGSDAGFGAGLTIKASQRNFRDSTKVIFETKTPFQIRFTSDGSNPTNTSFKAPKEITVSDEMTIKAAIFDGKRRVSEIESITVHKISESEWEDRLFVEGIGGKGSAKSYRANLDSLQRGVTVYADRQYTFTEIPDALAGATHLRTHNDDKANLDAKFLRFQTNLPAVLYLAYDGRTAPPKALTAGMEKTDMMLKISNGESFSVYRRMVEAGEVVLAGNKAGGSGGESMYQVFLTKEGAGKTTISEVKGALAKVDLKHGEEIFFGRGTCFACHKVGDRGVAIGPDLVGIGKRRDMDYVIQSTLEPDAYIVEGFQQTSLEMKDGRVLFGMIGEETALSLKLVLLTGEQIVVRPDEIKKRSDAKNSIMPASFSNTLSAQDVADISAWIMSLK